MCARDYIPVPASMRIVNGGGNLWVEDDKVVLFCESIISSMQCECVGNIFSATKIKPKLKNAIKVTIL